MKMLAGMLALGAAAAAFPAAAQTSPAQQEAAPAVDPARLAVARRLIDQVSPPDRRDATLDQIMRPMMANIRRSLGESPEFARLFEEQPSLRAQFDKFIDDELEHSISVARDAMPAMYDAMAQAYARRFTIDQLTDMERFFATPTGRAYAEQTPMILSDPAVQAAQRDAMRRAFDGLQDRVKTMAAQMQASLKKKPS